MTMVFKYLTILAFTSALIFSQNELKLKKDRVQVTEDESIKIDVLKNLFEIDWDWEKEEDYQNYIWEEAKTYCTNPDCHKDSYSKWCCHNDSFINGNVKNCNDIESIIEKEAEEFAQKMYDENDR